MDIDYDLNGLYTFKKPSQLINDLINLKMNNASNMNLLRLGK